MSHEEFFEKNGASEVWVTVVPGDKWPTVEQMYQAFKSRLIVELLVDVHNCPVYGRLVPKDES